MNVDVVLFDVIGTTVIESDPNLINHCFEDAFRSHGLTVSPSFIRTNRGRDKRETIRDFIVETGGDLSLENRVFERFLAEVKRSVQNFTTAPDAESVFDFLRALPLLLVARIFRRITDAVVL